MAIVGVTVVETAEEEEAVEEAQKAVDQAEKEAAFGMEFPQLLQPPVVSEQGTVNDPVTSGGDSVASGSDGVEGQ